MFSWQTFHPTGAPSLCTFHLFLMAGPSGTGPGDLLSVIALSSSEGSHEGESKNLKGRNLPSTQSTFGYAWIECTYVHITNELSQ